MDERTWKRLTDPIRARFAQLIRRGVTTHVDPATTLQTAQAKSLDGMPLGGMEYFEPYGSSAVPLDGAELVIVRVEGKRGHEVVLAIVDRRYRPTDLAEGDSCTYDNRGQRIHLTAAGIFIDGAGLPITISNTPEVILDTPLVHMTGDLSVAGNINAAGDISDGKGSMSGMRSVYNNHTQVTVTGVSVNPPASQM